MTDKFAFEKTEASIAALRRMHREMSNEAEQIGFAVDAATEAGNAEAARVADRAFSVAMVRVEELREEIERLEDTLPRLGAEARLRFHEENDTLDLY